MHSFNSAAKLALAAAAVAFITNPLTASAQAAAPAPSSVTISAQSILAQRNAAIEAVIVLLVSQVQKLMQQLAALQSQSIIPAAAATTTPGTAPVAASTTPSTAVLNPTITVAVNGASFSRNAPMTVTWSSSTAFGIDATRLPYLELFPYGANPIIVPSVRVARPAIGSQTYTWIVSKAGIMGDTVTAGKYLVQIALYNPALSSYIIGATPLPVTITP